MKMRRWTVLAVVLACAGVSGCWEETEVTLAEPGQYKGMKDPLLAQQAAARDEGLRKRFELVQMDR